MRTEPEIVVDCPCALWRTALPEVEDLCIQVAQITLAATALTVDLPQDRLEVSLLLTDDDAVRALNRDYRQQDKPTNVLSFAALDDNSPVPPDGPILLGDVVIAYQTTCAEAVVENKTLIQHLSHLVVHGVLHLLGYDHLSEDEAEEMESLERSILAALGVPDPYGVGRL